MSVSPRGAASLASDLLSELHGNRLEFPEHKRKAAVIYSNLAVIGSARSKKEPEKGFWTRTGRKKE